MLQCVIMINNGAISRTLKQMYQLLVLRGCRRHWNDGALVRNVQDGFSVHLPARVGQTCHELVQLCDKVVLDAGNANNTQTIQFHTRKRFGNIFGGS